MMGATPPHWKAGPEFRYPRSCPDSRPIPLLVPAARACAYVRLFYFLNGSVSGRSPSFGLHARLALQQAPSIALLPLMETDARTRRRRN
jgi:hypothetical protein